ncbi:hypothetical protein G7Y89_g13617 [Cudoniella acicularis]|uniref:Uncharacterized protein n=1 Tax=Cudoniella acicularis TaxID=354080 RepID=A0A8H4VYI3_9HELO|nr:hypothetical protein G7Y89_g13617 [Cudoniella acicularis]
MHNFATFTWFLGFSLFIAPALTQLIGPVGVTTPLHEKKHECNILHYGGVADNETDVGPAIALAFEICVKNHPQSRLVVPEGNYLLKQSIDLVNGTNWAFQLDGLITAQYGGNFTTGDFVLIENAVDFEFYSHNGKGAIQGQGYIYRIENNTSTRPHTVRLTSPINSTIHDLLLIDSPKFHFVFTLGLNIEIYHLTIRGANLGSYDGIDAVGTNYYIHDIEVTNRDECVSVKSPSHYVLVENLVCNRVGSGVSIGSLNVSAEISNIHARNISVYAASEIAFIKTYPGGSGYVTNVTWENFRSKASLSGMSVNQYWQFVTTPDTGSVFLSNITFKNFSGSIIDGALPGKSPINATDKPALYLIANDLTEAINITVEDFSVWTESNDSVINHINNFYGVGDDVYGPNNGLKILEPGATPTTYTSAYTITASPTGWVQPTAPAWAAGSTGWGTTEPIPVYTPKALWKPQGEQQHLEDSKTQNPHQPIQTSNSKPNRRLQNPQYYPAKQYHRQNYNKKMASFNLNSISSALRGSTPGSEASISSDSNPEGNGTYLVPLPSPASSNYSSLDESAWEIPKPSARQLLEIHAQALRSHSTDLITIASNVAQILQPYIKYMEVETTRHIDVFDEFKALQANLQRRAILITNTGGEIDEKFDVIIDKLQRRLEQALEEKDELVEELWAVEREVVTLKECLERAEEGDSEKRGLRGLVERHAELVGSLEIGKRLLGKIAESRKLHIQQLEERLELVEWQLEELRAAGAGMGFEVRGDA